jgi:hypothetical protein
MTVLDPIDELANLAFGPLSIWTAALAKIRTKDGSLGYFRLNEPQQRLDMAIEDQRSRTGRVRMLVPKARQLGISTYTGARFYRNTTRDEGQATFILTHEDRATQNLFQIPKTIHDNMEPELKIPASSDAANSLEFRRVRSSYGLATARTKAAGRSQTIQNLHGSEVAFWPNAETHLSGLMQAIPDKGSEIILESTGNGPAGAFYDLVQGALAGKNEFEVLFLPWFAMETYRAAPPEGWRPSSAWADYAALHGLDLEQVYWATIRNATLAVEAKADPDDGPCWSFMREYPATLAEVFVAPGEEGLIDPEAVQRARNAEGFEDEHAPLILGVDVARHGDDTTWLIDRRGRSAGRIINEQVQTPDLMQVVGLVVEFITNYRPARVFVDVTGMGYGVVDRLNELGYGRLVRGINFGEKAINPDRYVNRRAEMWWKLADWVADPAGADIPDDDLLAAHLLAPQYSYDSASRRRLERKEDMKKRLGYSPDGGDALALTFAEPVAGMTADERGEVVPMMRRRRRKGTTAWSS